MNRAIQRNRKFAASPAPWFLTRRARYAAALGLGVVLGMVWMLEGAGVPHYWTMTRELEQTKADIAELELENAALLDNIRLVESDPFTLERLARERLGYVREGETVYQLVESP